MALLDSAWALSDPSRIEECCRDAQRSYNAVTSYLDMFAIDHPDRQQIQMRLETLKARIEAVGERTEKTERTS